MIAHTALETSALLAIIEQTGMAVVTLVESLERDELLRSRLTRVEVLRQLHMLTASIAEIGPDVRAAMPELDWSGWETMSKHLRLPGGPELDDALWFCGNALVPATLLWLRVYRKSHPAMFVMTM